jgi:CBS domain-containing protein
MVSGTHRSKEAQMGQLAGEIMSRDVICVRSDADLRDLAKLFLEKGITGAPVVDAEGNLEGVISQTDLLYYGLTRDDELVMDSHFYHAVRVEGGHLPKGFQIKDVNTGRVCDVMTPVVHSVTERSSVESVSRMMMRKRIHRVIVRRGRKVAGIISALDILRAVAKKPKKLKKPKASAARVPTTSRSRSKSRSRGKTV